MHSLRPTGLAIDYPAQRLYFTDMRSLTIESTTLEGKDRQIVKRFPPGWLKPFKLDVFEDTLYFTNYTSNKILRLNKFGKNNVSDITYGVVKASDVVLIQQYKQISCKLQFLKLTEFFVLINNRTFHVFIYSKRLLRCGTLL